MADASSKQPFRFRGFQVPNYTQVPDELFDELLTVLSGAELKVTLYIIRRTFGFKKQSDNIALSQMLRGITTRDGRQLDRGVGLHKSTLLQVLRDLTDKGVIIATRRESAERGHEATNYMLNLIGVQSSPSTPDGPESPPDDGSKGRTPLAGKSDQGRSENPTKGLVGKSAPQETVIQETVKVVNALPGNDQKPSSERRRRSTTIADRALRATYGLNDAQIGQVHYLVEKQMSLLGAAERNHAQYVKRAAEAEAAGNGQLLDSMLGEFKLAATTIPVKSPPSFFHAMWNEALEKRQGGLQAADLVIPTRSSQTHGFEPLSATLGSRKPAPGDDAEVKIARILEDAASRGFAIPEGIRRSSHYPTVARWWAELPERAQLGGGRSGAP
jgi:hypothetical protein